GRIRQVAPDWTSMVAKNFGTQDGSLGDKHAKAMTAMLVAWERDVVEVTVPTARTGQSAWSLNAW
ncbi:MAG: hypothetical protein Q9226_005396, partial [Calogaya cf. arnoldii]